MKNILFISEASTKFRVLIDLALYFNITPGYKSFFYLDDFNDKFVNEPEVCRQKGIPYFFSFRSSFAKKENSVTAPKRNSIQKITDLLSRKLNPYFRSNTLAKRFNNEIAMAEDFLKEKKIGIIATCEDNYGISPVFIKAGQNLKINSVIFPFTLANHQEIAYAFRNEPTAQINTLKKKLFFFFNPEFKTSYKGKALSHLQPDEIHAQKKTDIAPYSPFITVGGKASHKLFESEFMLDYYKNSGFNDNNKVLVPGSLKFDVLHEHSLNAENLKRALLNELGLTENKPVILCALPPDYYPTPFYKDHVDIVLHWVKTLAAIKTHHVFINLHPRTKKESLPILKSHSVHVIEGPIEELIPLCDIFVASLSATIRYALTCNKKILNFDTVQVGYEEYKNVKEVRTVFTKEDFESSLKELCSSAPVSINESGYFGKLDGKCGVRIKEIFDKL